MKSLSVLDFAAYLLREKRYRVDVDTGRVTHVATGRELGTSRDSGGYPYVNLTYSRQVQKRVRVHRLVALAAWGIDAIRGREVAHLDGVKTHNALANLHRFGSYLEHREYDGTTKNILSPNNPRARKKEQWDPCARCGTTEGRIGSHMLTPARISARRFGLEGVLCEGCYKALRRREQRLAT